MIWWHVHHNIPMWHVVECGTDYREHFTNEQDQNRRKEQTVQMMSMELSEELALPESHCFPNGNWPLRSLFQMVTDLKGDCLKW